MEKSEEGRQHRVVTGAIKILDRLAIDRNTENTVGRRGGQGNSTSIGPGQIKLATDKFTISVRGQGRAGGNIYAAVGAGDIYTAGDADQIIIARFPGRSGQVVQLVGFVALADIGDFQAVNAKPIGAGFCWDPGFNSRSAQSVNQTAKIEFSFYAISIYCQICHRRGIP